MASLERIPRGHEAEPATGATALVVGIGQSNGYKGNQSNLEYAEPEAREVARVLPDRRRSLDPAENAE